jgi:uncharacterized membrane protein YeiH
VSLLGALNILGVFVFALSGATLAVEKRLDVFGVLVLAAVAALGGGLLRDVLLDVHPPAALAGAGYLTTTLVAGLLVFQFSPLVERLAGAVRLFDAVGLGLFVAAGTAEALDRGLGATGAVTLGCLTGIGGGVARDVLVAEVPAVLRREVYAVPALVGAAALVAADGHGLDRAPSTAVAAGLVFALRMLGLWRGWHAPVAPLRRRVDRG